MKTDSVYDAKTVLNDYVSKSLVLFHVSVTKILIRNFMNEICQNKNFWWFPKKISKLKDLTQVDCKYIIIKQKSFFLKCDQRILKQRNF